MDDTNFLSCNITLVTYNLHGYNQGVHTIRDLIDSSSPDIFLLQEHWQTPENLSKFSRDFPDYYCFGSSALADAVAAGPLYGRPFGGVMTMTKNDIMHNCECLIAAERFVIIKIGDLLIINVYLPAAAPEMKKIL